MVIGKADPEGLPLTAFQGMSSIHLLSVLREYTPSNIELLHTGVLRNPATLTQTVILAYRNKTTRQEHELRWEVFGGCFKLPVPVIIGKLALLAD